MQTASHQDMQNQDRATELPEDPSMTEDGQLLMAEQDPSTPSEQDEEEWAEAFVDDTFDAETLQALEWSKITRYFADLCRTEWGHQYALHLPFAATRREAERELEQVREAHQLLMTLGEEMPVHAVKDLRKAFRRLQKGGSLDASTLLDVAHLLETLGELRLFLKEHQEAMPRLWERGELLEPCKGLRREIEQTIDRNGSIKDDASWELGALRQHVRSAHEGIRKKMQTYLTPPNSKYLTDTYYTIRQDRYVLPVRASDQSKLPGIVYGSSGSGMTVFIEPRELVERNNALRIAEHDVSIEEARILSKLSKLAAKHVSSMLSNLELLRDLDLVAARVRMADALEAHVPELIPAGPDAVLDLKRARHPLLLLKEIEVVANDLRLGSDGRTLIISGPNTGGKTVSLKTMGICALMARAALPIPADAGSQVPFFGSVFTDIGDRQSIEHDLSTFSAQILKLRSIIQKAQDDTLVLIDEIVVGTDPEQGHALATAILEALTDAGAFVAVTTHYPQLKVLPHEDERFANACVGFNLETLEPTYRVYLGAPGGSSALAIARRLGMSEELCQRAETLLTPESDRFERVVSRLEQQYEELYAERERAGKARRQLERERQALRKKQEELEQMKENLFVSEELEWRQVVREARQTLRESTKELQKQSAPDWKRVREAEKQLQAAEEQAQTALSQALPAPPPESKTTAADWRIGQKVVVQSLRAQGELVELPDADGQVLVRVGSLRTRVPIEDIRRGKRGGGSQTQQKGGKKKKKAAPYIPLPTKTEAPSPTVENQEGEETPEFGAFPTSQNQCDLRGMRVDEAIQQAEAYLDRAFHEERDVIFLIHGHGTGVLRQAIRDFCRNSSYVHKFRPGQRNEGGNGVTVVLLV